MIADVKELERENARLRAELAKMTAALTSLQSRFDEVVHQGAKTNELLSELTAIRTACRARPCCTGHPAAA